MASNTNFNQATSGLEIANTYSSEATGKCVIIIGASVGGTGGATAHAFAHGGASTIIITGRNDEHLAELTQQLVTKYPRTRVISLKFDLTSLKQIDQAAQNLLADSSVPAINIVIANAGRNSFVNERQLTADGLEFHFGANHIGHFHFITCILPKIRVAAQQNAPGTTRIVMLTSTAIFTTPFRFSDPNFEKVSMSGAITPSEQPDWEHLTNMFGPQDRDSFNHHIAYGSSKTANVLMAVQLNTLFANDGIRALAVHPGFVVTELAKKVLAHIPKEDQKAWGFQKNTDQGCATTMVAALDPGLDPAKGVYLADCQVETAPAWAIDTNSAQKLWRLSKEVVEEKLRL